MSASPVSTAAAANLETWADAGRTRVREATREDGHVVVDLVKALATFEKEPLSTVQMSEADYMRDGFGPTPRFEVLIAELDNVPVGFALFFHTYSTWKGRPGIYVEDLFVKELARGFGLGRALLARIARIALDRSCQRIDLAVLHWNSARKFYEKLGFKQLEEWLPYRLDSNAKIAQLASKCRIELF
eukprot:jgi/Chlat1/7828/Chrsp66S07280